MNWQALRRRIRARFTPSPALLVSRAEYYELSEIALLNRQGATITSLRVAKILPVTPGDKVTFTITLHPKTQSSP